MDKSIQSYLMYVYIDIQGQITNKFLNLNCLGILARIPLLFSTIGGGNSVFRFGGWYDGTYRSSHSSMIQWKNDHLGTHGPNFHDSGKNTLRICVNFTHESEGKVVGHTFRKKKKNNYSNPSKKLPSSFNDFVPKNTATNTRGPYGRHADTEASAVDCQCLGDPL